jgi:hypothetical protein
MGPPEIGPVVATEVTVPPLAVLLSVIVPPSATVPPPVNPVPAVTVTELFASIALVTPAEGILIVPVDVIGPPVSPDPVATFVTVPPPPPLPQGEPVFVTSPVDAVTCRHPVAFVYGADARKKLSVLPNVVVNSTVVADEEVSCIRKLVFGVAISISPFCAEVWPILAEKMKFPA